jgi:hypothetical protein
MLGTSMCFVAHARCIQLSRASAGVVRILRVTTVCCKGLQRIVPGAWNVQACVHAAVTLGLVGSPHDHAHAQACG